MKIRTHRIGELFQISSNWEGKNKIRIWKSGCSYSYHPGDPRRPNILVSISSDCVFLCLGHALWSDRDEDECKFDLNWMRALASTGEIVNLQIAQAMFLNDLKE